MKRMRLSIEQIVSIVKQAEMEMAGAGVDPAGGDQRADLLSLVEAVQRVGGRSSRSAQASPSQDEKGRLKKLVAEPTLDWAALIAEPIHTV
jgi:hypothetical protein